MTINQILSRGIIFTAATVFLVGCGAALPVKIPQFPAGGTGEQIKQVMQGHQVIGIIAVKPSASVASQLSYVDDWSGMLESGVSGEFGKRGYFRIVDLSNRKDRLRELAYTQSGMTNVQKAIGQETAVDGMLILDMTAPPRSECKTELLSSSMTYGKAALQLGLAMAANANVGNVEASSPTGVRYLTLFVQGKLVNIESGRAISYSHSKPFRLANDVGNRECPSELATFNGALKEASKAIADHLSPRIITMKIPLEEDVSDVPGSGREIAKKSLKDGIKWAKSGDIELAARSWQDALDASGGRSASALWNLAAYNWLKGDMDQADDYFKRAMQSGGPDWMDQSNKREIWANFRKEKERAESGQQ